LTDRVVLTSDERAAARAFLQRSEVRLSTLHRVGSALLSGAGLMVLLPAIARDSLDTVVRSLVADRPSAARILLTASVLVCVALPIAALWLLLKELTRFYFNAVHLSGESSPFLPRYTLTGLRFPSDELGVEAASRLDEIRNSPDYTQLLVPDNERYRARVDEQHQVYHGGEAQGGLTDLDRVELLLEFAASKDRTLLGEVAKVEYGLARHVLRTQIIVLRYTKALIALILTAAAVYVAAAAVSGHPTATTSDQLWIGGAMALWAPWVMLAVSSPVRWLSRLLKRSDSTVHLVRSDREFTHFEDITVRLAFAGWLSALIGTGLTIGTSAPPLHSSLASIVASAASIVLVVYALVRWDGRRALRRLVGRHHSFESAQAGPVFDRR